MCKACDSDQIQEHCPGLACEWVVCKECGATTDILSIDATHFFAK